MADKFPPIPERTQLVDKNGFITPEWNRYFYTLFGLIFDRIIAIEAVQTDHETRITALEP